MREVQRDYAGDERTGEFAVGPQGDATPTAEYFGALGRRPINATGGPVYDGHDQVGSSVLTTDGQSGSSNGARMSRRYYTAFGERVAELGEAGQPPAAWAATTFGYCGAFGYEGSAEWPTESDFGGSSGGGSGGSPSNDNFWESDLGVLHVGARWYWPETGRFLQRDPIGIRRGENVYSYGSGCPVQGTDPTGHGMVWWPVGPPPPEPPIVGPPSPIASDDSGGYGGEWYGGPGLYGYAGGALRGHMMPPVPPRATPPTPHSGFHAKHVGGGLCIVGAGETILGGALGLIGFFTGPGAPFFEAAAAGLITTGTQTMATGGALIGYDKAFN
ncbi:MAG: RHS repeat-associated core domain-containing protein [Phycisphaerae bacterium]